MESSKRYGNRKRKVRGLALKSISKTKYMRSASLPQTSSTLGGAALEELKNYVYLGPKVNTRNDLDSEITIGCKFRRIKFNEQGEVMQSKIEIKSRPSIFNSTVVPAMTYGIGTWAATIAKERSLAAIVRAVQRIMPEVSLKDHTSNEEIRRRSRICDTVETIRNKKL
ncbi:hypothetical protein AB6A40_007757 [Gnathostoma spinigerum]|uniref:Ribosomal protein S7 n=1 Tax=Gnathostoma spinigerum TaxID=75299 RepID=A0ABD6EME3_9BILA